MSEIRERFVGLVLSGQEELVKAVNDPNIIDAEGHLGKAIGWFNKAKDYAHSVALGKAGRMIEEEASNDPDGDDDEDDGGVPKTGGK